MVGAPESMGLPELLGQEWSGWLFSDTPPAPSLSAPQWQKEGKCCLPAFAETGEQPTLFINSSPYTACPWLPDGDWACVRACVHVHTHTCARACACTQGLLQKLSQVGLCSST